MAEADPIEGSLPGTRSRLWAIAALLWLLAVAGIASHQALFWQQDRLSFDVTALLPLDEQRPEVERAARRLGDAVARQVVVMLGAPDWHQARRAAELWRASLASAPSPLVEILPPSAEQIAQAMDFYRPWRQGLLTEEQRRFLTETPPRKVLETALTGLYQPALQMRLTEWTADPLGLWPQWWSARAADSRARLRDGWLWLSAGGIQWAVLRYESLQAAFSLDGRTVLDDALKAAESSVHGALPHVQIVRAGVPLHGEAAAVQASREINLIGWGSLLAVLLLAWAAFGSLRPIVLVALSLLIAVAAAVSVTAWVFGQVHLITLVFGMSLIGVAEDYGIHYFAARQARPWARPRSLARHLLPSILLAMLTSVVAYLAMGIAAFPGLRQMALFSATGLIAAMLTVVCWFPWMDRAAARPTRFAAWIGGTLARWPRAGVSRSAIVLYSVLAAVTVAGLARLSGNDDLRQLQNSPPELVQQQKLAATLLGLPSPAQFFLVSGEDAEEVLQREEALKLRLDPLLEAGVIAGYSGVSDWIPSRKRQFADAQLVARVEHRLMRDVNAALGESLVAPPTSSGVLRLEHWIAHPVADGARALWLENAGGGPASVVLLRGVHNRAQLAQLAAAGAGIEGVQWVDRTAEISGLLERYRNVMSSLLLLGHVAVFALLAWRYGRQAWRAWLPTPLATVVTLAVLGVAGIPIQLFNVLALVLLLGVGVDYGVFLLEHRGDGSAWLAVVVGAISTWLAFGLLALSSTPALSAFGLTLLIGIAVAALSAPWLRATADA